MAGSQSAMILIGTWIPFNLQLVCISNFLGIDPLFLMMCSKSEYSILSLIAQDFLSVQATSIATK